MTSTLNKLKYLGPSIVLLVFPILAFGQTFSLSNSTFKGVILEVLSIIKLLVPILFGLAFIVFFWGLSKFILNSGNKEGIEKGKNYMFWGILALFILLSFQTIISFVSNDLGIGDARNIPLLPIQ